MKNDAEADELGKTLVVSIALILSGVILTISILPLYVYRILPSGEFYWQLITSVCVLLLLTGVVLLSVAVVRVIFFFLTNKIMVKK